MLTSSIELTWVQEVEDAAALASTHQDVEGLVRKVTLLEGELTEAR
jgi:chlorite dismutase